MRGSIAASTIFISYIANAAPTEGEPLPGRGLEVEESLGAEPLGLRVERGPPVHEVDRGSDQRTRRQVEAADLHRVLQHAPDHRDDGLEAKAFLHRRVEQRELRDAHRVGAGGRDLVVEPSDERAVGEQPPQRPRQRRRGRLVTGDQEGHELIVHFVLAEGSALVVAGVEHHRQHVEAPRAALLPAPTDLRAEDVARAARLTPHAPPGAEWTEVALHERKEQDRVRRRVEHSLQGVGQLGEARPLFDSEDGAKDDLERDVLHRPVHREGATQRPAVDRLVGHVEHGPAVGVHPLAVERGENHLPLTEVLRAVEEQQRVLSQQRLQEEVGLAGVPVLRAHSEDLFHRQRVGHDDHPRRHAGQAHRERVAEARLAPGHHAERRADPAEDLDGGRGGRAGRQGHEDPDQPR
jgi:hypothetical protein